MKLLFHILLLAACAGAVKGTAQPWKSPLMMVRSADGHLFGTPVLFQDSAGVPSVIRWHGDTLVAVFQWFRLPNPSPSWDRVAVKFSFDKGYTWTPPVPIVINSFPFTYQRPFDPAIVRLSNDSLRLFFSDSNGPPPPGGDSVINTYSAGSSDGIHYTFEPGARVDVDSNRVIDPSVVSFNGLWHYLAPAGAAQDGAYHYISNDGFNFGAVPRIASDNTHNWTGNYMVESSAELRFYGNGPAGIWYNASANGGVWTGYVNTNIQGGDPAVVKLAAGDYLMVYTGQPYSTGVAPFSSSPFIVQPNPATQQLHVQFVGAMLRYSVISVLGQHVKEGMLMQPNESIDIADLMPGMYLLNIRGSGLSVPFEKR